MQLLLALLSAAIVGYMGMALFLTAFVLALMCIPLMLLGGIYQACLRYRYRRQQRLRAWLNTMRHA